MPYMEIAMQKPKILEPISKKTRHKVLSMQYNEDGTNKRAMEADRAHYCFINPSQRSKRPQSPGSTSCDERNPMDSANWRSMEGSTAAVSTVPDMPPAVPTMGAPGSFSTHFKRAG